MSITNIKIRKKTIICILVLLVTIILFAIVLSFSQKIANNKNQMLKKYTGEKIKITDAINQLPNSYDANLLNKFKSHDNVKNNEIENLKTKINQLENQMYQLKNQKTHELNKPFIPIKPPSHKKNKMTKEPKPTVPHSGLVSQVLLFDTEEIDSDHAIKQNNAGEKSKTGKRKVVYPDTPYDILAGTSIPAVLQTKIVSDLSGFIVGIASKNIYDSVHGKYLIIPKGSRLIGSYSTNINYGEKAIAIGFNRLIRPDGSSIILEKLPAVSSLGSSGIGEVLNNHWGSIIGASLLSSVLSIPSLISASTNTQNNNCFYDKNDNYICNNNATNIGKSSMLNSIGEASSQVGNLIVERVIGAKPTVTVNPGYTFNIMVTKDLTLPPFDTN